MTAPLYMFHRIGQAGSTHLERLKQIVEVVTATSDGRSYEVDSDTIDGLVERFTEYLQEATPGPEVGPGSFPPCRKPLFSSLAMER